MTYESVGIMSVGAAYGLAREGPFHAGIFSAGGGKMVNVFGGCVQHSACYVVWF